MVSDSKKYLITWDAGYGLSHEVITATDVAEAEQHAYERWLETADSEAVYSADELTPELAEEYGEEDELSEEAQP